MAGLVVLAVILVFALGGGMFVRSAVSAIRGAAEGAEGSVAQVAVYAAAAAFTFLTVFLPLPAEASAFLNGSLFPSAEAFALTWTMAMAGAAASYEIGLRYGHRPAELIFGTARMTAVERLIDRAGWPTLLALRLSPVMAFTAINWASGILRLSRPVFYWTTAVGLLPGTFVFTVTPEILRNGASTTVLVLVAVAVMAALFGLSVARVRRPTT